MIGQWYDVLRQVLSDRKVLLSIYYRYKRDFWILWYDTLTVQNYLPQNEVIFFLFEMLTLFMKCWRCFWNVDVFHEMLRLFYEMLTLLYEMLTLFYAMLTLFMNVDVVYEMLTLFMYIRAFRMVPCSRTLTYQDKLEDKVYFRSDTPSNNSLISGEFREQTYLRWVRRADLSQVS